ncbi:MAG: formate/nitrite transporter family protein [Clostridia bacterium]|nr:formate/nitrite transporter family protein [Clostridia bacterium]
MKQMEKMTARELIVFCLMALFAGIAVGIGGTASLISASRMGGGYGKILGGLLFSLGMYAIISFDMRLFTGMVAAIPKMGVKNMWKLPVCFLCNALGVAVVAVLLTFSPIYAEVSLEAVKLIGGKLHSDTWALNALCSGVLCGILITMSIWASHYAPVKGLSTTVGVILPIVVFAFCGFDHSVANMLYFYFLGEVSWHVLGYILLSIVGNAIGGVLLPLVVMLRGTENDKTA